MDKGVKEARKLIGEALSKDEGLYHGYQSNIAMLLHDEEDRHGKPINYKDYTNRNEIAKKLIKLIFM